MSIIQNVIETSKRVNDGRNRTDVLLKIMEEVGELALEVAVTTGKTYKKAGEDGVVGEAIDVMICLIDLIWRTDPTLTEADILKIALKKLKKWEEFHGQHNERTV